MRGHGYSRRRRTKGWQGHLGQASSKERDNRGSRNQIGPRAQVPEEASQGAGVVATVGRDRVAAEKERAKDRWRRSKSDGAQVRVSPHPDLGASQMGNTVAKAMQSNKEGSHGCLRLGPREHIQMWRKLGADKALLQAIEIGIQAPITRIPQPSNNYQVREGIDLVLPAIEEYLADGAIRKLTAQETERTKYWVPIFPREKANGKVRVITDLRELNRCSQTPRHKAETWRSVLQVIADETLQWAITLDIKGYYHHLGIHPKTQRWMRFRV